MLMKQFKNELGHFEAKSEDERKVRSIRATDETWETFGEWASQRSITRADLLEMFTQDRRIEHLNEPCNTQLNLDSILEILNEALTYKANAGGAIKAKIREAIALINES